MIAKRPHSVNKAQETLIQWIIQSCIPCWEVRLGFDMLLVQFHPGHCRTVGIRETDDPSVLETRSYPVALNSMTAKIRHCGKGRLPKESRNLSLALQSEWQITRSHIIQYGVMPYIPDIPTIDRACEEFGKWMRANIRILLWDAFLNNNLNRYRQLRLLWLHASGCGNLSWQLHSNKAEEDVLTFPRMPKR